MPAPQASEAPFGGVPIRTITDVGHYPCPLAFAIDPYADTCPFHCVYCYATGTSAISFTSDDLTRLDALLAEALEGRGHAPWHEVLRARTPLRIGFLRDPFPPEEKTEKTTRRLLEVLNRHRYPFIVFTKSAMVAEEGYPELFAGEHATVQISMTCADEKAAAVLEPRAPSPRARLDALELLARSGVRAVARIDPLLRRVVVRGVEQDCFSLALLDELKARGACGVIFGTLNRRGIPENGFLSLVPPDEPGEYRSFIDGIAAHCRALGLTSTLCLLGPRPETFPVEPGAKVGSCCQVNEKLVPFGVSTWTRLSCSQLKPLEKASLWTAHEMMKKIRE